MKRLFNCFAVMLVAICALYMVVGCGGDGSSAGASSDLLATDSVVGQAQNEQEDAATELKFAVDLVPLYDTVTISYKQVANGSQSAAQTTETSAIVEFDMSGDEPKTYTKTSYNGGEAEYYTTGDAVVFVADGVAYAGTVDEFANNIDVSQAKGVDAYVEHTIGKLRNIVKCASGVSKVTKGDNIVYTVEVDAKKDNESDSAEGGFVVELTFDDNGYLLSASKTEDFAAGKKQSVLTFYDYDNTAVDSAPQSTKTYADLDMASRT